MSRSASSQASRGRGATAWWWVALFLLLGLVYSTNILRSNSLPIWVGDYPTVVVNSHPHFDRVSEVLVMNPIDAAVAGVPNEKGFLFHVISKKPDPRVLEVHNPSLYQPEWRPQIEDLSNPHFYRSQIGIQAWAYVGITRLFELSRDKAFALFWTFNAFALAAVLVVFIRFIYVIWGREAVVLASVFAIFSTGFNLFSWSMFWLAFLDVAPAAFATFLALRLPVRPWPQTVPYYAGLAVLFMLTLANGYEAMTVTLSSVAVPFAMVYAAGRISFKAMLGHAGAAVALGVAMFAATLTIHHFLYMDAFGGSGFAWVFSRTEHWGPESPWSPGLTDLLKILVVNAADVARVGVPVVLLLVLAAPMAYLAARGLVTGRMEDETSRIGLAVTVAMISSLSWPVIQFAHVAIHSRYMALVMAFPFALVLFGALGRLWAIRRERRQLASISHPPVVHAEPAPA